MITKSKIKIFSVMFSILVCLSLAGCLGLSTDETQIKQIAKNIEEAIKDKDVGLFMENISHNYSDDAGGTYDNHINGLPEEVISQVELAEALASSVWKFFKVVTDVTISNLAVTEQYASGKMEIKFSLKVCVGPFCSSIPWVGAEELKEYDVDFVKEDDDWKIISLIET